MAEKIRIGILGYGNLGKGVELAIRQNPDMELAAFFTRRAPEALKTQSPDVPVYNVKDAISKKDDIDVMILCGGSATDLPVQSPEYAKYFNIVDSFDTHAKIPEHFANVDASAKEGGHIAFISVGWDPGMFSLQRLIGNCILPNGKDYTFWGRGVSQGHSDAIRRIKGVKDGKQYTVPVPAALEGADLARIENEIKTMPNYFADYDTTVHFISQEELDRDHSGIPHGGFVIRTGTTGADTKQMIEYSLKLGSNPEFTSSVIVAYARAAYKMAQEGITGAKTVFDVAPTYLSPLSAEEQRKTLL